MAQKQSQAIFKHQTSHDHSDNESPREGKRQKLNHAITDESDFEGDEEWQSQEDDGECDGYEFVLDDGFEGEGKIDLTDFYADIDPPALHSNTNEPEADAANTARFESSITRFIRFMSEWCREIGTLDEYTKMEPVVRPLTKRQFEVLLAADPQALSSRVLTFIPDKVKAILGKQSLTINDLTHLPRVALDSRDYGCYFALSTRRIDAADLSAPSPVSTNDKTHEVGPRIRSGRVARERITRFYAFSSRQGVTTAFFILASLPRTDAENKSTAYLTEGLMQVYLNVVVKARSFKVQHHPAVSDFIDNMRSSVFGDPKSLGFAAPDFSKFALNGAWCLAQGEPAIPSHTQGCGNPECSRPEDGTTFVGEGENRRCRACYRYRDDHGGKERPKEQVEWSRKVEVQLSLPQDGCKNPNCLRREGETRFHWHGEDRRCAACYQWRKDHDGEERTKEQVELSLFNEQQSRLPQDGCKKPNCLRPETEPGLFHGWADDRRCVPCHKWRRDKGEERPKHKVEWLNQIQAQRMQKRVKEEVQAPSQAQAPVPPTEIMSEPVGPKAGCRNPNCRRPEEKGVVFYGKGVERRCNACIQWRSSHNGQERPKEKVQAHLQRLARKAAKLKGEEE
ncbi:hypothetical protein C8A00DRAFT_36588 [Chaetomidium leptoderma]|uniref:Uncharacterized protein n=1 Tax=Chaetomidium leptoderma TaxID=669021 RepID=A0AAN6ZT08_9PEZI|nr:hypothetical protein C8A00DRAFT_36588 [Chaetomidium leptoderma]